MLLRRRQGNEAWPDAVHHRQGSAKISDLIHIGPVDEQLISAIHDGRSGDRQRGRTLPIEGDAQAIPGKAGVSRVAAGAPARNVTAQPDIGVVRSCRSGEIDVLPGGVVPSRIRPAIVVAGLEFPRSVEGDNRLAELDVHGRARARKSLTGQQGKRHHGEHDWRHDRSPNPHARP